MILVWEFISSSESNLWEKNWIFFVQSKVFIAGFAMDESEKRRERLKAMRMEAAEAGVHGDAGSSIGASHNSLANPLAEASAPAPVGAEPLSAPRFDYYTDPMAAFSSDKRRSKVSHQISPDYFTPPSNVMFFIFYYYCVFGTL